MRTSSRLASLAFLGAAALAASCTTNRTVSLNVPTPVASYPAATVAPASLEYGRVTSIEYFPGGTATSRINVPGVLVGGVGSAAGRQAATVLGAAAAGPTGTTAVLDTPYRVTIQTDAGVFRIYDVPATGDLRVGDRVRIDSGVIYRS
jgi:outer membrane lipoprotein SlyB